MKEHFLLDPSLVFLNHGSFGACPAEVLEHCQRLQREMERNPVEFLGRRSAELLGRSRAALAGYLGAAPENLAFVTNATTGVNIVARSLPLRPGDEILTTDHEYGACDNTWKFVCRSTGADYAAAEIPLPFRAGEFADRVWARVGPRTRVIYLSHITSTTALILPIAELCRRAREKGILTLIDGAHAPGQLPLKLEELGADFYTGNCHKWLCAPKSAAFLYARPEHHALLDAPVVSWGYSEEVSGHADFSAYTGATLLERRLLWQGTRDLSAFLAVPAAIEFQARHGWDRVRGDCHALAAETLRRVCALTGLAPACGDGDFAQMVVLPVPAGDAERLKRTLYGRYRIEVPVTTHKDSLFVRLSVQGYNTRADADALVQALKELYSL
ncbi:MAG: aminotransferase class V-fold PLP-dependent enzyme [Elusimicrobia bacterium]|nr:aminotransferase class V-fold PLP-dependent enzyme [Elusimicrobiota bacterium]